MESSTKILRRMLDERGVEWWQKKRHTCWKMGKGQEVEMWRAWEAPDGSLTLKVDYIYGLTPAQAIAATLGPCNCTNDCTKGERTETCKLDDFADVPFSVDYEIEGYDMDSGRDYATLAECSACGAYIIVPPEYHHVLTCDGDEVYQPYRFCPNCGAKVVEPTTNDVDAEVDA